MMMLMLCVEACRYNPDRFTVAWPRTRAIMGCHCLNSGSWGARWVLISLSALFIAVVHLPHQRYVYLLLFLNFYKVLYHAVKIHRHFQLYYRTCLSLYYWLWYFNSSFPVFSKFDFLSSAPCLYLVVSLNMQPLLKAMITADMWASWSSAIQTNRFEINIEF